MGMLGLNSRGAKETDKSGNYGSGRRKRRFKSGIFEEDPGILGSAGSQRSEKMGKAICPEKSMEWAG